MEFIVPPAGLQAVRYRGEHDVQNASINVATLLGVETGHIAWYPDNEGTPAIDFLMAGVDGSKGKCMQWLIPKNGLSSGEYLYSGFHTASLLRDHILAQIVAGNTKPVLPSDAEREAIYAQAKVLERAALEARWAEERAEQQARWKQQHRGW